MFRSNFIIIRKDVEYLNWNYTVNRCTEHEKCGKKDVMLQKKKQLKENIPCLAFVFAHRKINKWITLSYGS